MSEKIATREAYGKALAELGNVNDKVVVLDADLAGATMTKHFKAAHPERFFDCGIAEADMVDISAGLSTMGLVPFCSTFAMFGAGRAYEQIRNSIAYPRFNVKICCSHAGVSVGEDGGSHQAIEDIGLMRLIPGMTVVVPADATEARKAVFAAAEFQGPLYMRLGRLASPVFEKDYPFEIGKANVMREGTDAAVFACGLMVSETLEAAKLLEAEGIHIAVINVHTIKPIDADCVSHWARKCGNVVTVEEHSVIGRPGRCRGRCADGQGQLQVPQDRHQRSVRPVRQGPGGPAGVWSHRRPDRGADQGDSVNPLCIAKEEKSKDFSSFWRFCCTNSSDLPRLHKTCSRHSCKPFVNICA